MVYNWKEFARSRLYPSICLLCGAEAEPAGLCLPCRLELPYNRHCCRHCALPLPLTDAGRLCGQCQRRPPPFHRAVIPLLYRAPIDYLVTRFKFDGGLHCGHLLASLLADALHSGVEDAPQLLIPVPLHRDRISQRGFNQALELTRPLARQFGLPVDCTTVVRTQATAAQSRLGKRQRQRNLRAAFGLDGPIKARHLALVDDVVTTGATAATLVLHGGAERVDLWALARTP